MLHFCIELCLYCMIHGWIKLLFREGPSALNIVLRVGKEILLT